MCRQRTPPHSFIHALDIFPFILPRTTKKKRNTVWENIFWEIKISGVSYWTWQWWRKGQIGTVKWVRAQPQPRPLCLESKKKKLSGRWGQVECWSRKEATMLRTFQQLQMYGFVLLMVPSATRSRSILVPLSVRSAPPIYLCYYYFFFS